MSIGSRIKELRIKHNITQEELAKMIGVTKGAIANYENEVSSPKIDLMYKLFDALDCDANYLHQDDMKALTYKNKATPEEFENIIKKYRSLDPYGQETVNYILERESTRVSALDKKDFRIKELEAINALPPAPRRIYTYLHKIAAAGVGFYFDDIPTDTIEAPYRENADFIVGVNGDSMEPTYSNGDLVYVEKCQIVEPGEIGIFIVNSECFIKEAGHDELISHNKKYKPIPGTEYIICVGRVLGKVNTDETAPAF